jgi:hypothetical protein
MSQRLNQDREKELQPKRLQFAKDSITDLGYEITKETDVELQFTFKGNTISIWPYSGWHSGKGITPGRGIEKLLKQIKTK